MPAVVYRAWSQFDPRLSLDQKKRLTAHWSSRECWDWFDRLPLDARAYVNYAVNGPDLIERMLQVGRAYPEIWRQVEQEALNG